MSGGSSRDGDGQLSGPTTLPSRYNMISLPIHPSHKNLLLFLLCFPLLCNFISTSLIDIGKLQSLKSELDMAGMCCGVVGETKTPSTSTVEPQSRRRRMEIQQLKLFAAAASNMVVPENKSKRRKVIENSVRSNKLKQEEADCSGASDSSSEVFDKKSSRFGLTVVCGRRRDLEDAVAVKPSFCKTNTSDSDDLHFYGVYDGHGCSHVRYYPIINRVS